MAAVWKEGNDGRFRLEGEERQWFVGQKDSSASTLICVTGVIDLPGGMGDAKGSGNECSSIGRRGEVSSTGRQCTCSAVSECARTSSSTEARSAGHKVSHRGECIP